MTLPEGDPIVTDSNAHSEATTISHNGGSIAAAKSALILRRLVEGKRQRIRTRAYTAAGFEPRDTDSQLDEHLLYPFLEQAVSFKFLGGKIRRIGEHARSSQGLRFGNFKGCLLIARNGNCGLPLVDESTGHFGRNVLEKSIRLPKLCVRGCGTPEEARLKRVHHVQRLVQFVLEKIHD